MRVWNSSSGDALAVFDGHQRLVNTASFSPDGSRIVTASDDHTAKVWDTSTGVELATLRGHYDRVKSGEFSPDGSMIITNSSDRSVKIWRAAPWRLEDLPGDNTMDWQSRFALWKKQRYQEWQTKHNISSN